MNATERKELRMLGIAVDRFGNTLTGAELGAVSRLLYCFPELESQYTKLGIAERLRDAGLLPTVRGRLG